MVITHVLFDADGVLQRIPGGWFAAMEPYVGDRAEEFITRVWAAEHPLIVGQGDYLAFLTAHLADFGVTVPAAEVYASVWHDIEVVAESIVLLRALRDSGYGVHLGTNQERERGTYMRTTLGFDDLFDVSCYSYELGVAKPDEAFFMEAARRIGGDPTTILFIDDTVANVEVARVVGFAAEHWHLRMGHDHLHRLLAGHGVSWRR